MKTIASISLAGLFVLGLPPALSAQQPHRIFAAAGIGLGTATHDPSNYLGSTAISKSLRAGYRFTPKWAGGVEVISQHLNGYGGPLPAYLCPQGMPDCAPPSGPVNTTSVGVGIYRVADLARASWTFTFAPSWTWFAPEFTTARSNAPGIVLGSSVALGTPGHLRPMVQARYQRSLRGNALLSSVLEVGIGISWH